MHLSSFLLAAAAVVVSPTLAAPAPAPVPATRGTIAVRSKRGISYNQPAYSKLFSATNSKISWMYDWAQTAGAGSITGLQFTPMLWNSAAASTNTWARNVATAIAGGSPALLGFNEPDLSSQANMDVATAVAAWKQYMEPFAGKIKLVAPAVTNGPTPMGLDWTKRFIAACTGCTIDAIAIHWYDSATNFGYLQWYMGQAYAAGGNRPLWLTEFGASGNSTQVQSFLKQALPYLDGLSSVERYAYFYAGPSTDGTFLLNQDGSALSDVGKLYMTL